MVKEKTRYHWRTSAMSFLEWASKTGYHIHNLNKEDLETVVNRYCSTCPRQAGYVRRSELKAFIYWKTEGKVRLRFNVVSAKTPEHAQLIGRNLAIQARFVKMVKDKVHKKEIAQDFLRRRVPRVAKFVKECNELERDLETMNEKDLVDARKEHVKEAYSHTAPQNQTAVTNNLNKFINWLINVERVASGGELRQASMADNWNSHPTKRHKNNADTRGSVRSPAAPAQHPYAPSERGEAADLELGRWLEMLPELPFDDALELESWRECLPHEKQPESLNAPSQSGPEDVNQELDAVLEFLDSDEIEKFLEKNDWHTNQIASPNQEDVDLQRKQWDGRPHP